MVKTRKDPRVHRPDPKLTVQEVMVQVDSRNMLDLVRDLIAYMPQPFKQRLLRDGCVLVKLGKYQVQVTVRDRFEQPVGEYGKANW